MVQTFLFVPLVWKGDTLALRVRKQMDSGEPGIIDIGRYRLDFHPEEKGVLCGVAPGHAPEGQDAVGLTRCTIKRILEGCGRMDEFANDPATFLEQVTKRINRAKYKELARGIRYVRLPESEWYEMGVLDMGDARAYLGQNAWKPEVSWKSLYSYVVYDSSTVEQPFAAALDRAEEVKVYAKLPPRFTIDTPVGTYNPDWAYVQEVDGQQKFFFVVETKGGGNADLTLRPEGRVKTDCARRHFAALNDGVEYEIKTTYSGVWA